MQTAANPRRQSIVSVSLRVDRQRRRHGVGRRRRAAQEDARQARLPLFAAAARALLAADPTVARESGPQRGGKLAGGNSDERPPQDASGLEQLQKRTVREQLQEHSVRR